MDLRALSRPDGGPPINPELGMAAPPPGFHGGMPSWWDFLAYVLLPVPAALVVLLSVPAPRDVRRVVLHVVERFVDVEIRPGVRLLPFFLLVTGASAIYTIKPMLDAEREAAMMPPMRDANQLVMVLATRFLSERNFWVSLFTFSAWAVLYVVHQVNREKHMLRGELLALRGQTEAAVREVAFLGGNHSVEMRDLSAAAGKDLSQKVDELLTKEALPAETGEGLRQRKKDQ